MSKKARLSVNLFGLVRRDDRAFAWLEKALSELDTQLFMLQTDACFAELRRDARYAKLLASLNLDA